MTQCCLSFFQIKPFTNLSWANLSTLTFNTATSLHWAMAYRHQYHVQVFSALPFVAINGTTTALASVEFYLTTSSYKTNLPPQLNTTISTIFKALQLESSPDFSNSKAIKTSEVSGFYNSLKSPLNKENSNILQAILHNIFPNFFTFKFIESSWSHHIWNWLLHHSTFANSPSIIFDKGMYVPISACDIVFIKKGLIQQQSVIRALCQRS